MHPRLSVDQLCFPGATLVEFAEHCRTLGAHHVVLSSPQLLEAGSAELAKQVLKGGAKVEAINHPFAIYPDLESDDGTAAATLARLIPIAAELGTTSIYLITGGRGNLGWAEAADRFRELVASASVAAKAEGMALMIENASALYADIHIAHTLADTLALAERAGLGVCIELQFCWAEAGLHDLFQQAVTHCGLVQVSDYVLGDRAVPGRAVPGDGALPLEHLLASLLEAGYAGLFDIELIGPRIDAEGHLAAVARAADQLGSILNSIGA